MPINGAFTSIANSCLHVISYDLAKLNNNHKQWKLNNEKLYLNYDEKFKFGKSDQSTPTDSTIIFFKKKNLLLKVKLIDIQLIFGQKSCQIMVSPQTHGLATPPPITPICEFLDPPLQPCAGGRGALNLS